MPDEARDDEPLMRAARVLRLWPVVGLPLGLGLFGVLFLQGQALRAENARLEQHVAALHAQVVQVRKTLEEVDADIDGRQRAARPHAARPASTPEPARQARQELVAKARAARREAAAEERPRRPQAQASGARAGRAEAAPDPLTR